MRGKILLVVGLGVGYVLGTRAGRSRYNQIKGAALKIWNDPRVQEQVTAATEFVKENAPEVADAIAENVKKFTDRADTDTETTAPTAKPTRSKSTTGATK